MARYAIVVLKYRFPLERILQTSERHRAYLRELHARGKLVASGPFEPRSGGGLILRVADEAELQALLAQDPYQQEGLVETQSLLWAPNIGEAGLDALAPAPKAG